MLDKNAQIEQLIYTAGGLTKIHGNNGSFGVWSKTKGLEGHDIQSAINDVTNVLKVGNESDYARQTIRTRVLKQGATPSGLFRKSYKDSDYEEKTILKRDAISVLQQSKLGALRGGVEDYRANPEKAPFRIGATKLPDGRLLVVRIGHINRVYSEIDNRTGNYFSHALVFPQGTNIEDIDLNAIDWKYGLEDKYWKGEGVMAPDYLETTSISKMQVNLQNRSQNANPTQSMPNSVGRNLSEEELLQVYKQAQLEKDPNKRRELKKIFSESINNGANLIEVRKLAYVELIGAQKSGKDTIDIASIVEDLERESCKFDELFDDFSTISGDTSLSYQEQKQKSEQLKWKLSRCDMPLVVKFAESQKELFTLMREYERLTNSTKTESEYTRVGVDNSYRFVTYCQGVLQAQKQGEMGE